jgi:MSHA biogenesis protein MshI
MVLGENKMASITTLSAPWLRRLRRARLAASGVLVGAQWIGGELVLARVHRDLERPEIDQVTIMPAPQESRAELVKKLAGARQLAGASLVLTLAPGQYDLHQLAAPAVPAEELRDALRWQLRSNLAYAPEEAAIDFVRVPHGAESHTKEALLVVTAHRPMIEGAVAPFTANGVFVEAVDIPEFAQRNLARLAGPGEGTSAWLGFERETCLLTAHLNGELAFARRMLLPGANHNAIDADTPESIMHVTDRIVTQAQRTLDTFERQSGLPPVTRITVGPHRHAASITDALADRTGLIVTRFNARTMFDFGSDAANLANELPGAALPAIGAALRVEEDEGDGAFAGWAQRLRAAFKRAA